MDPNTPSMRDFWKEMLYIGINTYGIGISFALFAGLFARKLHSEPVHLVWDIFAWFTLALVAVILSVWIFFFGRFIRRVYRRVKAFPLGSRPDEPAYTLNLSARYGSRRGDHLYEPLLGDNIAEVELGAEV